MSDEFDGKVFLNGKLVEGVIKVDVDWNALPPEAESWMDKFESHIAEKVYCQYQGILFGAATAGNQNTAFTSQSISETITFAEQLEAKRNVRKSQTYFSVLAMAPCVDCGHKIEYHEEPRETFVVCECQYKRLQHVTPRVSGPEATLLGGFAVRVVPPQSSERTGP